MLAAIDEETLAGPFFRTCSSKARSYKTRRPSSIERMRFGDNCKLLDAYQSAGTVPFNVKELNVDFATGGSVKWLCGGPGAGYLYIRPDLHDKLQPKTTGWMAHEDPFSFSTELRYAPTVARFSFMALQRFPRFTPRSLVIASSTTRRGQDSREEREANYSIDSTRRRSRIRSDKPEGLITAWRHYQCDA
jgi:hypothetical protein